VRASTLPIGSWANSAWLVRYNAPKWGTRNLNWVSVTFPRLKLDFRSTLTHKPLGTRLGWCGQCCRATWGLQLCQLAQGLVWPGLWVIRCQSGVQWNWKVQISRLRIFLSVDHHSSWLVGHFWACSGHFHEMAILELLFLIKFSTTLLKVAPPCKISKLDFLIGQTRAS
jgi:hypothetical protein